MKSVLALAASRADKKQFGDSVHQEYCSLARTFASDHLMGFIRSVLGGKESQFVPELIEWLVHLLEFMMAGSSALLQMDRIMDKKKWDDCCYVEAVAETLRYKKKCGSVDMFESLDLSMSQGFAEEVEGLSVGRTPTPLGSVGEDGDTNKQNITISKHEGRGGENLEKEKEKEMEEKEKEMEEKEMEEKEKAAAVVAKVQVSISQEEVAMLDKKMSEETSVRLGELYQVFQKQFGEVSVCIDTKPNAGGGDMDDWELVDE